MNKFISEIKIDFHPLIIESGVLICICFITLFIGRRLVRLSQAKSIPRWLQKFGDQVYRLTPWITLGYGTLFFIEILVVYYDLDQYLQKIAHAKSLFLVLIMIIISQHWRKQFTQAIILRCEQGEFKGIDPNMLNGLSKVISIIIIVVGCLISLDIVGVPVSALLAFGGVGGLAVSLAAKDMIANIFGGLMIFIHRPFITGDWINSSNKGFEGTVEEIGWYRTRIRTFERRPLYIPNSIMTEAIIENPGRMYNRRIKTIVALRHCDSDKVEQIVLQITKMLKNHPSIDQNQTLMVHFLEFGPYSLNIEIYCFTKTTDWHKYRDQQQDVFLKVINIVHENNADISLPSQNITLKKNS